MIIEEAKENKYDTQVDYTFFTEPVSCEVHNDIGSTNVSTLVDVHCEWGSPPNTPETSHPVPQPSPLPASCPSHHGGPQAHRHRHRLRRDADLHVVRQPPADPHLDQEGIQHGTEPGGGVGARGGAVPTPAGPPEPPALPPPKVLSNSNQLYLKSVTQADAGQYVCKAIVPRIGVGEREVTLYVNGERRVGGGVAGPPARCRWVLVTLSPCPTRRAPHHLQRGGAVRGARRPRQGGVLHRQHAAAGPHRERTRGLRPRPRPRPYSRGGGAEKR